MYALQQIVEEGSDCVNKCKQKNLPYFTGARIHELGGMNLTKFKQDVGGAAGFKREALGKVQFTFPFNLGFTAINSLRAAESDSTAASRRVSDLRDQIEEQARNAWSNLITAGQNAALLQNQANIAAEFLDLARKERQLGKRTLIDVLAGETNLINAQSDAISAQSDVIIAGLSKF